MGNSLFWVRLYGRRGINLRSASEAFIRSKPVKALELYLFLANLTTKVKSHDLLTLLVK
jgi:hypothetical protein